MRHYVVPMAPVDAKRSLRATMSIRIGAMAVVDEIVFHQLAGWPHLSDG